MSISNPLSTGTQRDVKEPEKFAKANAIFSSASTALILAIKKNPGVGLLISASIGVALACLIKRR